MYEYFDEMYGDSLEHHGILGQRWGIRRFQNYDGTLKKAGKDKARTDRKAAKEERKAAKAETKAAKIQAKADEKKAKLDEVKAKAIADGDVDTILKLRGSMTSDELKEAMNRVVTIRTISDKKLPEPKSRVEKINDILGLGKKTADSITGLHRSINDLKKEFGLDKESLAKKAEEEKAKSKSKSDGDGKDIFDKVGDLYNKVKANNEKKQAERAAQKKENDSFIKKLEKLNGSNEDKPFKLKEGDWSIFKNNQKSGSSSDNDSWIKKLSSVGDLTSVKLPSISTPSESRSSGSSIIGSMMSKIGSTASGSISVSGGTKSFFGSNVKSGSSIGDTKLDDLLDSANSKLLNKNNNMLGL